MPSASSVWSIAGRLVLLAATGLAFALINQRNPLSAQLVPLYALTVALVVAGVAMIRPRFAEKLDAPKQPSRPTTRRET
jgi:hypothetical protein